MSAQRPQVEGQRRNQILRNVAYRRLSLGDAVEVEANRLYLADLARIPGASWGSCDEEVRQHYRERAVAGVDDNTREGA